LLNEQLNDEGRTKGTLFARANVDTWPSQLSGKPCSFTCFFYHCCCQLSHLTLQSINQEESGGTSVTHRPRTPGHHNLLYFFFFPQISSHLTYSLFLI